MLRLRISVAALTKILAGVMLAFIIISIAGQLAVRAFDWEPERDIISFTNMDRERNAPTSFQAFLMLSCVAGLAGITVIKRLKRDRWTVHWGGLALFFFALAWDESTEVHERFIEPMRRIFDLEGLLFFGWIVPAGIAVAIFALAYLRFVLDLEPRTRARFILAGVIAVTGALVLESVGGAYYESIDQNANMMYVFISTVEETLEMTGMIIFLHTILTYLGALLIDSHITMTGQPCWIEVEARQDDVSTEGARREAMTTSRRQDD